MAARARPARSATATRRAPSRKTTSRQKRRPAARRKPAARRGESRIRWDRVGRIALTLVLAAVLYSYLNPAIDFVKTYTATTAAKAEFHEMLRENKRLHNRIQTADEPDGRSTAGPAPRAWSPKARRRSSSTASAGSARPRGGRWLAPAPTSSAPSCWSSWSSRWGSPRFACGEGSCRSGRGPRRTWSRRFSVLRC